MHPYSFLISALDRSQWQNSRPFCFSQGTEPLGLRLELVWTFRRRGNWHIAASITLPIPSNQLISVSTMQNLPFYFVLKLHANVYIRDTNCHISSYLPFILFRCSFFLIIDWHSNFSQKGMFVSFHNTILKQYYKYTDVIEGNFLRLLYQLSFPVINSVSSIKPR